MDSHWLEGDWHDEIEKKRKEKKKQRKGEPEKASGYYPPELIYDPSDERENGSFGNRSGHNSNTRREQEQMMERKRRGRKNRNSRRHQ